MNTNLLPTEFAPQDITDFVGPARKVAERMRNMIWRGVTGATRFVPGEQSAYTFPTQTKDPSLGMPHQFLQIQDPARSGLLIAPSPYDTAKFVLPPWMKA